jgi:ribosomal protein S3
LYSSTGTNLERIFGKEGIQVRISEFSDASCCCHLTAVAAKPAAMLHRRAARAKLQKSRKLKKTGVYVNIEVLFLKVTVF